MNPTGWFSSLSTWLKGTAQQGYNTVKNSVFWNQNAKMWVASKKEQYANTIKEIGSAVTTTVQVGNKALTVLVILVPMYIVYKFIIKK